MTIEDTATKSSIVGFLCQNPFRSRCVFDIPFLNTQLLVHVQVETPRAVLHSHYGAQQCYYSAPVAVHSAVPHLRCWWAHAACCRQLRLQGSWMCQEMRPSGHTCARAW